MHEGKFWTLDRVIVGTKKLCVQDRMVDRYICMGFKNYRSCPSSSYMYFKYHTWNLKDHTICWMDSLDEWKYDKLINTNIEIQQICILDEYNLDKYNLDDYSEYMFTSYY